MPATLLPGQTEALPSDDAMPFELHWEPRGVLRRFSGDVTIAERRRSFDLICGDRRFDDLRYAISDYLGVSAYEATPRATQEIAALHIAPLRTNPAILIAAVAVAPAVVAAVRDFMSLGYISQPYRLFETEADARVWIAGALNQRGADL